VIQSSPLPCGGGAVSPELLVEVRVRVALHMSDSSAGPGERVRFFGTVTPGYDGLTVSIQRRKRKGSWIDVAQTVLKNSRFSRGFVPRAGGYRARVGPDADHAGGTSRSRRIS
jgi:hypothetical protein